MKNLIYLASALLLVLFCLTSYQKEDLTEIEQPTAAKTRTMTAAGSGSMTPVVLIDDYEDGILRDCCEQARYTMNNTTHNHFINLQNKKYKVTFTKNGQPFTYYTTQKTFYKYWSVAGTHTVHVQIVNQNNSPASASSQVYTFTNVSAPPCTPC